MQKRKLGAQGPEVSAIGVGAMSFAGVYGNTKEERAHQVLDIARDAGVDHIDTANVYGMGVSEQYIGSYLARHKGEPPFRIATKAAITRDPDTGARSFDNSPAHLEAELDGSLKRLGVERVTLFYVHRRDPRFEIEEVTETLAGFVRAGKVEHIGYSEIAPSSLRRAAEIHPVAAVQSEYSLSTRYPDLGLVQTCAELGTALVAFSPVGRGFLTDTPPDHAKVDALDFLKANPRFMSPNLEANLKYAAAFGRLAADMGTSAAALAIAWLLHRGPHVIPIPGTRDVDHMRQLADGMHLSLSDADMDRIESVLPVGWAHGDRYNTMQWDGPERYC